MIFGLDELNQERMSGVIPTGIIGTIIVVGLVLIAWKLFRR